MQPPPSAADPTPDRTLTRRGWGFVAVAVICLLLAQLLGRKDLLHLGVLLACLPAAALGLLRLMSPGAGVKRAFTPAVVEAGTAAAVTLTVSLRGSSAGTVLLHETLPDVFGPAPAFPVPPRGNAAHRYRLRPTQRGLYPVGPLTAAFTDPFGLAHTRRVLGGTDLLIVTPAPQDLPRGAFTALRSADGTMSSTRRASPSDDDVMTRDYRPGDPMRRVHWPATARHGALMVRQEESVTTPQATVLMDQRHGAWLDGFTAIFGTHRGSATSLTTSSTASYDGAASSTSPAFEWAVTAAMSISTQLLESGYILRFLDHSGGPALRRSPSAAWPDDEVHQGRTGLQHVAEGLAALAPETAHTAAPFAEHVLDKLAAAPRRGPLVALLGGLTDAEAQLLAPAAAHGSAAIALIAVNRPEEARRTVAVLRGSGWRVAAVTPGTPIPSAWAAAHP